MPEAADSTIFEGKVIASGWGRLHYNGFSPDINQFVELDLITDQRNIIQNNQSNNHIYFSTTNSQLYDISVPLKGEL